MGNIRKNGKAYDNGDVSIDMLGAALGEVEDIDYTTDQEHQLNYALGSNKPKTWSRGKKSYKCSLTIAMTEGVQIESIAPDCELVDLPPFDVNVSFTNEFNNIINDTLTVKFMNQGRSIPNGEMGLKFKYEMFVLDIKYNNA